MSVAEIMAQAQKLSPAERKQLVMLLVDSLDVQRDEPSVDEPAEHWGKALNKLMDEIGPIELVDPEIEDPVEWVKKQRADAYRRRLGDWGEEE